MYTMYEYYVCILCVCAWADRGGGGLGGPDPPFWPTM